VRAPTLLRDYDMLENAIGAHLPRGSTFWERVLPDRTRNFLYRLACERGYLDAMLDDYVGYWFRKVFRTCDQLERRWTDFLAGRSSGTRGMP
jgi:NAD(P)H-quinone oxidoreductase subunit 5